MPVRFSCPLCFGDFVAADNLIGQQVACPGCKGRIDVPAAGAVEDARFDFTTAARIRPPPPGLGETALGGRMQLGFGIGVGIALGLTVVNLAGLLVLLILSPAFRRFIFGP